MSTFVGEGMLPPPPEEFGALRTSSLSGLLKGRYRFVRQIGTGGMGIVDVYTDTHRGQEVAIKRIRARGHAPAPQEVDRLRCEARALAALDLPVFARLHEFFLLPDGFPYLVMDLIPGKSLYTLVRTSPSALTWPVCWSLVDQLLVGLGHAHARGILHGDLNPSNVRIDLSQEGVRAYLIDLGLSWYQPAHSFRPLEAYTSIHPGAGTPGWVAPEQIRSIPYLVNPATELYALGCILYFLLTGQELFENSPDRLKAHKREIPSIPPLSSEIPAELPDFLMRLLHKQAWHRFAYAAEARRIWKSYKPENGVDCDLLFGNRRLATGHEPAPVVCAVAQTMLKKEGALKKLHRIDSATEQHISWMARVCEEAKEYGEMEPFLLLLNPQKAEACEYSLQQEASFSQPLAALASAFESAFSLQEASFVDIQQILPARYACEPQTPELLDHIINLSMWLRPLQSTWIGPLGLLSRRYPLEETASWFLQRIGASRPLLFWLQCSTSIDPLFLDFLLFLETSAPSLQVLCVATFQGPCQDLSLNNKLVAGGWEVTQEDLLQKEK